MEPTFYPHQDVWQGLLKLRRNDLVRITWHDACSFDRVQVLTPEIYVTALPRTGYFYDLRKDPASAMVYLIMSKEITIGEPPEGDSIPVSLITSLEILVAATQVAQGVKEIRRIIKAPHGGQVKVIEHRTKVGTIGRM